MHREFYPLNPIQGINGTEVEIKGNNFTSSSIVKFNNVEVEEVTFVDAQTLQVKVPPLATTGKISVENSNGKTVSADIFTVLGSEVIFFEDWEDRSDPTDVESRKHR